jgi:hypothetical protein
MYLLDFWLAWALLLATDARMYLSFTYFLPLKASFSMLVSHVAAVALKRTA